MVHMLLSLVMAHAFSRAHSQLPARQRGSSGADSPAYKFWRGLERATRAPSPGPGNRPHMRYGEQQLHAAALACCPPAGQYKRCAPGQSALHDGATCPQSGRLASACCTSRTTAGVRLGSVPSVSPRRASAQARAAGREAALLWADAAAVLLQALTRAERAARAVVP